MLPDGDIVPLTPSANIPMAGCRLDPARLADLATRLATRFADGADILIINRFGQSEAGGKRLDRSHRPRAGCDIPVLIAVPERRFHTWIRFSDGMNVRLPCRREALDRWWHSMAGTASRRNRAESAHFAKSRNETAISAKEHFVIAQEAEGTSVRATAVRPRCAGRSGAQDGSAIGLRIQRSAAGAGGSLPADRRRAALSSASFWR